MDLDLLNDRQPAPLVKEDLFLHHCSTISPVVFGVIRDLLRLSTIYAHEQRSSTDYLCRI